MTRRRNGAGTDHTPDRGDLDRLLEAERSIADRLAAARAEARRIVEEAEASAREAEAAVASEAAGELERVRAAIQDEYRRKLDDLAADTRRRVAAHEAIPAERVEELVTYVVERVVTG